MYKIALCESDEAIRQSIVSVLKKRKDADALTVMSAADSYELCDMIMSGKHFDLIIMPYELKGDKRLFHIKELQRSINRAETRLLYTGSALNFSQSKGLQLFDMASLSLIIDPKNQQALTDCVDEAIRLSFGNNGCLGFSVSRSDYVIPFSEIRFIESCNKRVIVHTTGRDHTFYSKLDDVRCSDDFIRIHKSYLVNRRFVRVVNASSVELDFETVLPISRSYRKSVRGSFAW